MDELNINEVDSGVDEIDELISDIDNYDNFTVNEKGELVMSKTPVEGEGEGAEEGEPNPADIDEEGGDSGSGGSAGEPDLLAKLYEKIESLEAKISGGGSSKKETKPESKTSDELLSEIKALEEELSKEDSTLDDADFGRKTVQLNKLTREYNQRLASGQWEKERAMQENVKVVNNFKEKYSDIPDAEIKDYYEEAVSLFGGDTGVIKESDIEAVLIRRDSEKFKKYLQLSAINEERKRIAQAQSSKQPRISATGRSVGTRNLSLGELAKRNPQKFRKVLKRMSNEELAKLKI